MWLLSTILYMTTSTFAEMPERPLRPTTHPGDPALSEGAVVNFQRLYIDPETIANQLVPQERSKAKLRESLAIINRTTAWVDITVSGNKIGRIGPLTTGVIHDLTPGKYAVDYVVEHTQFSYSRVIETTTIDDIITPGNKDAAIAATPDYIKPGFDALPAPTGGQLTTYTFPLAPAPTFEVTGVEGDGDAETNTTEDGSIIAVPVE